jgi:eukaryotic-like serine/threonine-protein kinase
LLDDAAAGEGSLPLLEYTLDELVGNLEPGSRVVSYEAYQELGGLSGAIGRRIEDEVKKLGGMEALGAGIETLVCHLTQIGREDARVARMALLADLKAAKIDVKLVQKMVELRLLVTDGTTVRVAHEALLTKWGVADEILKPAAGDLRLRDRLEPQADQWRKATGSTGEDYLLRSEGQLKEAMSLLRRRPWALSTQLIAFIESSDDQYQTWLRNETARLAADEQSGVGYHCCPVNKRINSIG